MESLLTRATGARLVALVVLMLTVVPLFASAEETATPDWAERPENRTITGNTFRVFAHREGLVGHTTANGHVIQPNDFFVALPCFCVLSSEGGNEFEVTITYQGNSVTVPVWDVGPWNVDDNYWDPPEEREWTGLPQGLPAAEAAYYDDYNGGLDGWDREIKSPAGIDIGDGAFYALGMTDSDWVDVTFHWLEGGAATVEEVAATLPALPDRFQDLQTVFWNERPPLDWAEQKVDDPRYVYESITGHNMPVAIRDYWQSHGSWQFNGLPISEFYRQVYQDGSVEYLQYFERTVISMSWPEDGSGPVISTRGLGYDTYIDPAAAEPVEPFTTNDAGRYFPETGHSIHNGFRSYFESHGGVDVFGLPISQEWGTERNGQKVVFQVFENARLEWWPANVGDPDKHDITLGLLTVEQLQRAGWIAVE